MSEKEMGEDKKSETESPGKLVASLRKPIIPHYDCLPTATPPEESKMREGMLNGEAPIPGFGEFRKYKSVNETRTITQYKPEQTKDKPTKSDTIVFPAIEIENVDRFLIEKIKSIPVQSLESLLQMIHTYPDIGFVTMNRPHMDLLNDYQPYKYTICNYNDKDENNYVTISTNGLIEFYKQDADFMPLDRLLLEYKLYCALKEIPLFSTFYFWKAFMVWFKKIRQKKFLEAKAKIEAFFIEKLKS